MWRLARVMMIHTIADYRLLRHFNRRRQRGDRGQSFLKSLPGA